MPSAALRIVEKNDSAADAVKTTNARFPRMARHRRRLTASSRRTARCRYLHVPAVAAAPETAMHIDSTSAIVEKVAAVCCPGDCSPEPNNSTSIGPEAMSAPSCLPAALYADTAVRPS